MLSFSVKPCPDGFEKRDRLCLKAMSSSQSYDIAEANCRNMGATLPVIRDPFTNQIVQAFLMDSFGRGFFWIGLKKKLNEIVYKWSNNQHFNVLTDFKYFTPTYQYLFPAAGYCYGGVFVVNSLVGNTYISSWGIYLCSGSHRYACMKVANS